MKLFHVKQLRAVYQKNTLFLSVICFYFYLKGCFIAIFNKKAFIWSKLFHVKQLYCEKPVKNVSRETICAIPLLLVRDLSL